MCKWLDPTAIRRNTRRDPHSKKRILCAINAANFNLVRSRCIIEESPRSTFIILIYRPKRARHAVRD